MVINGEELWKIEPIKGMEPGKKKAFGVSHGLGEAGYDIRCAQQIIFGRKFDTRMVEVSVMENGISVASSTKPGKFTLASTVEEFQMPTNLVGIVHDKSTWARQGLSVFNTVIEPGWSGFLTLELVYHGEETLIIPAGAGIAQVVFHELAESACYSGKYQDQANEPVPAIFQK
ncbi:putative dCTP deaminase [Erwinia phage Fifi067]|nr:putative dCTP deaminase [Erwinia phage Fifi067]WBQ32495.1 dCTP deaminase [Erwinia phage Kuerle]